MYDKVPRRQANDAGVKPITVRWVDVNKGDDESMKIRSRLVGRELKVKTKEALLAHELFSAMPPWEMIKVLLGLLVTDGIPGLTQSEDDVNQDHSMTDSSDELMLGIFDISRAHFMPKAERELYIEIPKEDFCDGDGDVVGKLNRNMYGFRDAANGWFRDWQSLLASKGYKTGVANPALFHNPQCGARGGAHCDIFLL